MAGVEDAPVLVAKEDVGGSLGRWGEREVQGGSFARGYGGDLVNGGRLEGEVRFRIYIEVEACVVEGTVVGDGGGDGGGFLFAEHDVAESAIKILNLRGDVAHERLH